MKKSLSFSVLAFIVLFMASCPTPQVDPPVPPMQELPAISTNVFSYGLDEFITLSEFYWLQSGATVYYTLDGSDPKASQTKKTFTEPVSIDLRFGDIVLKAYQTLEGWKDSPVYTTTISKFTGVPKPEIKEVSYNVAANTKTVEIINYAEGTTVYYNINSDNWPSKSDIKYTGSFSVNISSGSVIVKAVAISDENDWNYSELVVLEITPVNVLKRPSISSQQLTNESGNYTPKYNITLTNNHESSSLYYTVDETDPTTSPTRLLYTEEFTIDTQVSKVIVKAVSELDGKHSEIIEEYFEQFGKAEKPTIYVQEGEVPIGTFVDIRSMDRVTVYYTSGNDDFNPDNPESNGWIETSGFRLTNLGDVTYRIIAIGVNNPGITALLPSDIVEISYTVIEPPAPEFRTVSPVPLGSTTLSLVDNYLYDTYITAGTHDFDITNPEINGWEKYNSWRAKIDFNGGTSVTYKAINVYDGRIESAVTTKTFTLAEKVSAPIFSLHNTEIQTGADVRGSASIEITSSNTRAEYYYTTDNTDFNKETWTKYIYSLNVNYGDSDTITYRAMAIYGTSYSDITEITINKPFLAPPLFNPPPPNVRQGAEIYISPDYDSDYYVNNMKVYYTFDSIDFNPQNPTENGWIETKLTGEFICDFSEETSITVHMWCIDPNDNYKPFYFETAYTLSGHLAPVSFSPNGGEVVYNTELIMQSSEGAEIYYTTGTEAFDTDNPTANGWIKGIEYSWHETANTNITFDTGDTVTYRAVAKDGGFLDTDETSVTFTLKPYTAPTIHIDSTVLDNTEVIFKKAQGEDYASIYYTTGTLNFNPEDPESNGWEEYVPSGYSHDKAFVSFNGASELTIRAVTMHADGKGLSLESTKKITQEQISKPTITPNGGQILTTDKITLSADGTGEIYYTTLNYDFNPANPSANGWQPYSNYSGVTIDRTTQNHTLRVVHYHEDYAINIAEANFTIPKVEIPIFTPNGGNVTKITPITISCNTQGALIEYKEQGSNSWNQYIGEITANNKTITARATKAGYIPSDEPSRTFSVREVKMPSFDPPSNSYIDDTNTYLTFTIEETEYSTIEVIHPDEYRYEDYEGPIQIIIPDGSNSITYKFRTSSTHYNDQADWVEITYLHPPEISPRITNSVNIADGSELLLEHDGNVSLYYKFSEDSEFERYRKDNPPKIYFTEDSVTVYAYADGYGSSPSEVVSKTLTRTKPEAPIFDIKTDYIWDTGYYHQGEFYGKTMLKIENERDDIKYYYTYGDSAFDATTVNDNPDFSSYLDPHYINDNWLPYRSDLGIPITYINADTLGYDDVIRVAAVKEGLEANIVEKTIKNPEHSTGHIEFYDDVLELRISEHPFYGGTVYYKKDGRTYIYDEFNGIPKENGEYTAWVQVETQSSYLSTSKVTLKSREVTYTHKY